MKNTGSLEIVARGDREIVMTRTFDAPRNLVFEAFTKAELLKRWLGVRAGWSLDVCDIDLKVGGKYRWVWRNAAEGTEMGVGGVFREVVPPERLAHTETFDESWYKGEGVVTTQFDEQDGRTLLTITLLYESKEARDGVISSPMAGGVSESYDKLAEVLASLTGEK